MGLGMYVVGQDQEAAFLVLLGAFLLEEVSIMVVEGWGMATVLVFLEMNMAFSLEMKR